MNSNSNPRENEIRRFAGHGQLASEISFDSNLNHLSGKVDRRITQVLNGLLDHVNKQIQRAINEAINEQVFTQVL